MFEGNLDGGAVVREADIGDDRGSAYCMLAGRELRNAGRDAETIRRRVSPRAPSHLLSE